jgi:hypothetical protein
MVFPGQIHPKMLSQTIRHRIISRITFYACVVSLLWLMDKATQAYQQAQAEAPTQQEQIQQMIGAIGR